MSNFQFMALRFWRLWPCHLAVILLIVLANGPKVVHYFITVYSPEQLLVAIFLLQAWSPDTVGLWAVNGPAWSISAELFFYALFPFLSQQAALSPNRPVAIGALITITWLFSLWLYKPTANLRVLAECNPLARIFEFTIGVSAYAATSRFRLLTRATFIELVCIATAIGFVYFTPNAITFFQGYSSLAVLNWLSVSFSAGAFAALIVAFSYERGVISRLLASAPLVYLGEISFATYLVHQPVIFFFAYSKPKWFWMLPNPLQICVFIIIVLGLSSLLHHFVEKPCMIFAKKLILPRAKPIITVDVKMTNE
jgi:peptidoglycan/LPS O-acetylase OafA/YrhL